MDNKFIKCTYKCVCTYKYQSFAQSQLNVAPPNDGETVTFRNSVMAEGQRPNGQPLR